MMEYYHYLSDFQLESGESLPGITVAYCTYGRLSLEKDNVIWVCHALTANADVADWWPHTVAAGKFLDPERYFVVCANILGSHYGTTGPLTENPRTGKPWYNNFPLITIRDMVRVHYLLAQYLGIQRVKMLIGGSIGGFQCLEWAVMYPDFMERLAIIATAVQASPWMIAFNESQRMAIELDPTFGFASPEAGAQGLATARSIALLSYRGPIVYNRTQQELVHENRLTDFRVSGYQRHQGDKLRQRFNAYSYYRLTQAIDSHNLARGRGMLPDVVSCIRCRCCVVSISSDILFLPSEHEEWLCWLPNVEYHRIDSDFGHDGFLIEHEKLNCILLNFER